MTNAIMDHVGCPSHWWLLCMLFVVGLLNWFIPHTVLTREVTDVSPYLDYHFWQEVFVKDPTQGE